MFVPTAGTNKYRQIQTD